MMPKAVGIDLGTTNSVVAVVEFEGAEPTVIATAEGSRTCPSVVAFKGNERLVGELAKRQAVMNPHNTINSIKRFMGRRYSEVEAERKMMAYKVVVGKNEFAAAEIEGKQYMPEEISAMILTKLKKDAEAYLGEAVHKAVITVPAYFNDAQRNSTKLAGQIAGLEVLRVINEPTAAAIAYGVEKKKDGTVLVWDLGGGTFDVSILKMEDGVYEVKSTNGDTHLGGDDWDEALVNYIANEFQKEQSIDLRKEPQALMRLREAAEKAKKELSTTIQTQISLPFIAVDASGPKNLEMTVTRAKFEELTKSLLERCRKPFEDAIKDANLKLEAIDEVILVGGSTRMPAVQDLVNSLTGKEASKGANPDEVVAVGASIQAATLTGMAGDGAVVVVDITPLSIGVEVAGGMMNVMIPRNTPVPFQAKEVYTTARDFQPSVDIKIFQGERPMARDNRLVGTFELGGIPPAPKGTPQVEVTMEVDANSILHVSAKELGTGVEQKVTITDAPLSEADIQRMLKDAEAHASADQQIKQAQEARNRIDSLTPNLERALQEYGDKVPEEERNTAQAALSQARSVAASQDTQTLVSAADQLESALRNIGEAVYRASSSASASEPTEETIETQE